MKIPQSKLLMIWCIELKKKIKQEINENTEVIIHIEPYDGRDFAEDSKKN